MNCDQFVSRMDERLDQRLPLEGDHDLARHAHVCSDCRQKLETWAELVAVLHSPSEDPESSESLNREPAVRPGHRIVALAGSMAAVAATVLAVVMTLDRSGTDLEHRPGDAVGQSEAIDESAMAQVNGVDPSQWWQRVQSREWVDRTMPAVRSVQEGVAPIGRSLMRALTILTTSSSEQTS